MYRKYDTNVPAFLHNRPKSVVQHIMKRASCPMYASSTKKCGARLFTVTSDSSGEKYQVWLGSKTQLPSCQCIDYRINRLPCKHICLVVNQPGIGWESLGQSFDEHPLFRLDPVIVASTTVSTNCNTTSSECASRSDSTIPESLVSNQEVEPSMRAEGIQTHKYHQLKKRKQPSTESCRARCVTKLKALHDELYVIKDKAAFAEIQSKIEELLGYARSKQPVENNLPLKDKTMSPRKKKEKLNEIQSLLWQKSLCHYS